MALAGADSGEEEEEDGAAEAWAPCRERVGLVDVLAAEVVVAVARSTKTCGSPRGW